MRVPPGGGGYSLIWAIWGRAAGQGMVFGLAVLNRVYASLTIVYLLQKVPGNAL